MLKILLENGNLKEFKLTGDEDPKKLEICAKLIVERIKQYNEEVSKFGKLDSEFVN